MRALAPVMGHDSHETFSITPQDTAFWPPSTREDMPPENGAIELQSAYKSQWQSLRRPAETKDASILVQAEKVSNPFGFPVQEGGPRHM